MSQEYFVYIPEKNVSTSKCLTKPSLPPAQFSNGARGSSYLTGALPNIGSFEITETEKTKLSPTQKPFTIENCVTCLEKEAQEFLFHDKPLYFSINGFETKKESSKFGPHKMEGVERRRNLFFWCFNDILIMKLYMKTVSNPNHETFSVYHLNKNLKRCDLLLNVPAHNSKLIPLKTMLPVINTIREKGITGDIMEEVVRTKNFKDLPPHWYKNIKGPESMRLCIEATFYLRNEFADHINEPTPEKLRKLITGFQYFRINEYINFLTALSEVEYLPNEGSVPELKNTINQHIQKRHKAHVDFFCGKPAVVYAISVPELETLIALARQCQQEMDLRFLYSGMQCAAILESLEALRYKDYSGIELPSGVSRILESDPIRMPKAVANIVREYCTFFPQVQTPIVQPMMQRLTNLEHQVTEKSRKMLEEYRIFLSDMESKLKNSSNKELAKLMLSIDSCYLQGLEMSARLGKEENKRFRQNFRELLQEIYTSDLQKGLKVLHIPSEQAQHIYMKLVEAGGGEKILGRKNDFNGNRFGHALKGCEIEAFGILFTGRNGFNIFIDDANKLKLNGLLADVNDPYYQQRRKLFNDLYKEINKFSEADKDVALKLYDRLGCTNFNVKQEVNELMKATSNAFLTWSEGGSRSETQQKIVDLFKSYNKHILDLSANRAKKTLSPLDKKSESSQSRKRKRL